MRDTTVGVVTAEERTLIEAWKDLEQARTHLYNATQALTAARHPSATRTGVAAAGCLALKTGVLPAGCYTYTDQTGRRTFRFFDGRFTE